MATCPVSVSDACIVYDHNDKCTYATAVHWPKISIESILRKPYILPIYCGYCSKKREIFRLSAESSNGNLRYEFYSWVWEICASKRIMQEPLIFHWHCHSSDFSWRWYSLGSRLLEPSARQKCYAFCARKLSWNLPAILISISWNISDKMWLLPKKGPHSWFMGNHIFCC